MGESSVRAMATMEDKVNKIVDEYIDKDSDGMISMDEVCKFFGHMKGVSVSPEEIEDENDLKELVGKSAAEAKEIILKMCDSEEKLDACIASFSSDGDLEALIERLVKCIDTD